MGSVPDLRPLLEDAAPGASLTDRAYVAIRRAIADLAVRPGEPIAEQTLAQALGMSRTPVREAILRLRQEKWVHSVPRRGLYVSPISLTDLREMYEALEGLEAVTARLVVERAGADDLRRLGDLVAAMEGAAASPAADRAAWHRADLAFHDALTELAGNAHIRELRARFGDQIARVRDLILRLRQWPPLSTAEHRALYDALLRRDAPAAMLLAHAHRARAREEFVRLLSERVPYFVAP